jgi:hypothetical protein
MSIEDCKQGLTELLAGTKLRVATTEALQKRVENMMEVNAKYGDTISKMIPAPNFIY